MHRTLYTVKEFPWENWLPEERAVLCFVRDVDRLLMIVKKRGLGAGKINAPGGRIEDGETPLQAAIRETEEETHVHPVDPELRAELSFVFRDGYTLHVYAFLAESHTGTPHPTEEADPFWCPIDELPYDRMWADDRHWLPRMLDGRHPVGRFVFDDDTLLDMEIREMAVNSQCLAEEEIERNA